MAATLCEDLGKWNDSRFLLACREHRKRSSYMPDAYSLIEAYAAAPPAEHQELPALPSGLQSQEQRKRSADKGREFLAKLRESTGMDLTNEFGAQRW